MTDEERIARGKRIYEACVVYYQLDAGESVDLLVVGDVHMEAAAGIGGIILADDPPEVQLTQDDYDAVTAYLEDFSGSIAPL